jgi:hypothetical protein
MSRSFFAPVFVGFETLSIPCYAQIERPLAWLRDLTALQNEASSSLEYRQVEVSTIRKEVQEWAALHSEKTIAPFRKRSGPTNNFVNRATF